MGLGPAKFGLLYILVSSHSTSVSFASCSLLLGLSWLWQASSASLILYSSGSCQLIIFILLGPSFFHYLFFSLLSFLVCHSLHLLWFPQPFSGFPLFGWSSPPNDVLSKAFSS